MNDLGEYLFNNHITSKRSSQMKERETKRCLNFFH